MAANEVWQEFEGRALDPAILLGKCLAFSDHSAVFETGYRETSAKAAVKLISVEASTAARQLRRVEAAARLSHPGLLRIFRCGLWPVEEPRVLYIVMEYAAENLSEVVPQRALTADETREVLGTALDVLTYLHAHGCVHGHLKPSNILAVDDRVKLSSDGVTRIGDAPAIASPDLYHPPEASRGSVAPAWDVWALGVTVVQVLTQQAPAWGRTEPRRLLVPVALPEPFREIARNCLQDDPQRRWTVERIQARLAPGAPPEPLREPAPVPAEARAEWNPRRYAVPAAGTGAAVLALLVVLGLTHQRPQTSPAPRSPAETAPAPKKAIEKARPSPFATPGPGKNRAAAGATATQAPGGAPPPDPAVPPTPPPPVNSDAGRQREAIVRRVTPNVPAKARDTIQGKVRVGVLVQVNGKGNVTHAGLQSPGPSRYFAKVALEAAREWKFAPALSDGGDPVRSWILRFEFRRSGTQVQAVPGRAAGR